MAKKRYKRGVARIRRIISTLIVLCLVFVAMVKTYDYTYDKYLYPVDYTNYVDIYAEEYGVDKALVYAVIKTESGFNSEAISNVGAQGLMQMTEDTFEWLKTKTGEDYLQFSDLFKPQVSIKYGTLLLSMLLEDFSNDPKTALSAYHAGRASVQSWLEKPEYSANGKTLDTIPKQDTQHYVDKVMSSLTQYEKILSRQ